MEKPFIIFSSITYAQLARDTLLRYSIRSQISRNSNPDRRAGCNYLLYVDTDIDRAHEILERENVKNMGIKRGGMR